MVPAWAPPQLDQRYPHPSPCRTPRSPKSQPHILAAIRSGGHSRMALGPTQMPSRYDFPRRPASAPRSRLVAASITAGVNAA